MKQVGIVGWRGMVGSVLLQRMLDENDFKDISAHFYSTSNVGAAGPVIDGISYTLKDAYSIDALAEMDIIITCQGGDYTKAVYQALIAHGWEGYLKWSTKTGHRVRVFPVSIFRFVWG